MLTNPSRRLGDATSGDSGRDTSRKIPIRTEKNPTTAPVVLYPKKLNATDSSPISKLANNMNDTSSANVAINYSKTRLFCFDSAL